MEPNGKSFLNVKPGKILFFKTDINEKDTDHAFLYMARTAQKLGNDVGIFTSRCPRKFLNVELKDVTVYQVGRFIPKHIFGWGRLMMYLLRTLYMIFWLVMLKKDLKPTFVVIHNSIGLVALLKLLGVFTVVHMYTFQEEELLKATLKGIIMKRNCICNFFMRMANEIVVLDKLSRTVLTNAFYLKNKHPTILYPCVIGSKFHESPIISMENIIYSTQDDVLLVCFGPMRESSNFELCIEAFSILLIKAKISNSYLYHNTYLVIASQYKSSPQYDKYCTKLKQISYILCGDRPSVIFLHESPSTYRKTLISKCEAVLVPMVCLNARTIFEASIMKKPVIAANCGIARELIREGINGFLPRPEPLEFAKCMVAIVFNRHHRYSFSQRVSNFFQLNFGMLRYAQDFKGIVARNSR